MATRHRIASESGYYHIMSRGNNRNKIFQNDSDCRTILNLMRRIIEENPIKIYAYCVMPNHYHMLVRVGPNFDAGLVGCNSLPLLGHSMLQLNTGYAQYYRKKYQYAGHVFQGRYLSRAIDSERYLGQVIRYIHENPVKANLVETASEYPFSSYRAFFCKTEKYSNSRFGIIADDSIKVLNRLGFRTLSSFETYHFSEDCHDAETIDLMLEDECDRKLETIQREVEHAIDRRPSSSTDKNERISYALYLKQNTALSLRLIAKLSGVSRNTIGSRK